MGAQFVLPIVLFCPCVAVTVAEGVGTGVPPRRRVGTVGVIPTVGVAPTVGVTVGEVVAVGVGFGVLVAVAVGVGDGVGVGTGVLVAVAVGVGVNVGVGVGDGVLVAVAIAVGVGVGTCVLVGRGRGVAVAVGRGCGVGVGLAVCPPVPCCAVGLVRDCTAFPVVGVNKHGFIVGVAVGAYTSGVPPGVATFIWMSAVAVNDAPSVSLLLVDGP